MGWIQKFGNNLRSLHARSNDSTAWCAIFVSKVLHEAGYKGTNHALAIKYAAWGKPSRPVPGAVIVLRRNRKAGANVTGSGRGGFHVAILMTLGKNWIEVCGGNQSDGVSVAKYARKHYTIIAIRKPSEM